MHINVSSTPKHAVYTQRLADGRIILHIGARPGEAGRQLGVILNPDEAATVAERLTA